MFCGKCGSTIPDGNVFCSKCGAPITDSSEQPSDQIITQPVQVAPVITTQPSTTNKANVAATIGFIFSIIGLCLSFIPVVGLVLGVVGLILSIVGISKKKVCGRGGGLAITGLILSIVALLIGTAMTTSLNSYLKRAQTAYESIQQQSANSSVVTNTQTLGNIKYEVPSSWSVKESDKFKYFYPDKNDSNVFLMVFRQDTEITNWNSNTFDSFVDGLVSSFTSGDGMQTPRINKREVEKKDSFYIAKLSLKADFEGKYREMLVYVAIDSQTGIAYNYMFMEPENVSEANKAMFNYVTNSIQLR